MLIHPFVDEVSCGPQSQISPLPLKIDPCSPCKTLSNLILWPSTIRRASSVAALGPCTRIPRQNFAISSRYPSTICGASSLCYQGHISDLALKAFTARCHLLRLTRTIPLPSSQQDKQDTHNRSYLSLIALL